MNPAFSPYLLYPLAALLLILAAWASWRSSAPLTRSRRALLLALRIAAVAAALIPLLNPGKWVNPQHLKSQSWLILTDRSLSMQHAVSAEKNRAALAAELTTALVSHAEKNDIPHEVRGFADALLPAQPWEKFPPPTIESSRPLSSLQQAFHEAQSAGQPLAGIILLSDGRPTEPQDQAALDALALRALANQTPVHTVAITGSAPLPDLELTAATTALTAFPAQPLSVGFHLRSNAMAPQRCEVILSDETGKEITRATIDVPADKTVSGTLTTIAPTASARWTIQTAVLPLETRAINNRCSLNLRVINAKTRVFIAEGSPYWDSKFLAQLLRQQKHMEVKSLHRLSDERYFRVDSSDAADEGETQTDAVFPATVEEFAQYDLIVFGKNIDSFLDADRSEALRQYVRDHGGAVLFARGKATSREIPALEPLDPVTWATGTSSDFRFIPTRDGQAAGLFGDALPAPDAPLWAKLPPLKDGHQVGTLKPFSRVLAEGSPLNSNAASARFPLLVLRRYGQGVTAVVNADGLWKWDFFPEARELGNAYEEFWTQLIQWMASYSEFLPGHDYSLRLPATQGAMGETITVAVSYRGPATDPTPALEIIHPDGSKQSLKPAAIADPSGRPLWRASFTPVATGLWKLTARDEKSQSPAPAVLYHVPAPPQETDDLSPDIAFLENLALATHGTLVSADQFPAFLKQHLTTIAPASQEAGAQWQPAWNKFTIALAIAALLATEWFLRRRQGLA